MISTARRVGLLLTATTVTIALAACGGGAQPGAADAGEMSAWGVSGGIREAAYASSFDAWNEENPDSQITFDAIANDAYKERIRTSLGAGTNPTLIFSWGGGTLADYAREDKVVDLTDATEDVMGRILPSIAQAGMIDDRVYGVANGPSQPAVLYYNRDLFDEVGLEVPETWDELREAVDAFREAGHAPFGVAGQSRWPYLPWIQYLTDRIGGPEVFQAILDGEPDAWSDPAITQALEYIQELVEAGAFAEGYASVGTDAGADLALLYTGRVAMLLQMSTFYSVMKADATEWVESGGLGFAPFPAVEGGDGDPRNIVGNPSNFWSVGANASAEEQEAASTYLNDFVFSDEYVAELIEGEALPPVAGIEDELAARDEGGFLSFSYELIQDAPHFQLSWDQALPPAQAQELLVNLEQIFLMETTPAEFVTAMNATLD